MGFRRSLPDADERRRSPTRALPARGLQRSALPRSHRRDLADDAARLASLASGLPAGAALVRGGLLRSDGGGPAGDPAGEGRPKEAAERSRFRQPYGALHAREWSPRRL